jgi:DNA-binding CsgD family transcriptional regulator
MHGPDPHSDPTEDERCIQGAVRAHRWLLDGMLRRFPNGSVSVFDRDLRYLYAAGEGLGRVGLSPASLIGKRLADLFPADSVAQVAPSYERALGGEAIAVELAVFGRRYAIHASPLREPGGRITAIVAVVQEVPARPRSATEVTPRQREVAALIAAGLTNEQIAGRLVITPGTVANHVEQILRRLDFAGRAQIAVWAAECGLYRSTSDQGRRGGAPQRPG